MRDPADEPTAENDGPELDERKYEPVFADEVDADEEVPSKPAEAQGLVLTAARLVPWAVTIGYAIWLGSLAFMDGAIALVLLMVPWVSIILVSRRWIDRVKTKTTRIGLDLAVITGCVLGVSLGGLWMLPGATAFTALDVVDPGTRGTRVRAALVLAGLILLAALPGLLFAFLIWPAALLSVLSLFVKELPAPAAASQKERF